MASNLFQSLSFQRAWAQTILDRHPVWNFFSCLGVLVGLPVVAPESDGGSVMPGAAAMLGGAAMLGAGAILGTQCIVVDIGTPGVAGLVDGTCIAGDAGIVAGTGTVAVPGIGGETGTGAGAMLGAAAMCWAVAILGTHCIGVCNGIAGVAGIAAVDGIAGGTATVGADCSGVCIAMAGVAGACGVAAINTGAAVLGKGIGSLAGVILAVVPIRCGGGGWLGGFGSNFGFGLVLALALAGGLSIGASLASALHGGVFLGGGLEVVRFCIICLAWASNAFSLGCGMASTLGNLGQTAQNFAIWVAGGSKFWMAGVGSGSSSTSSIGDEASVASSWLRYQRASLW